MFIAISIARDWDLSGEARTRKICRLTYQLGAILDSGPPSHTMTTPVSQEGTCARFLPLACGGECLITYAYVVLELPILEAVIKLGHPTASPLPLY